MQQLKSFSDFNIRTERFNGKKIPIEDVLGVEIELLDYRIEPSKKYSEKGNGMLLTLQIRHQGKERVIFTGSTILQEQCLKLKEIGEFRCMATIIELKPRGFKFV